MRCGDRVFGLAAGSLRHGPSALCPFLSYIDASGSLAALIPQGQSYASMASLPTVALLRGLRFVCAFLPTVSAALELGRVLPGDFVAVQAGAGIELSPCARACCQMNSSSPDILTILNCLEGGTGALCLAAMRRRGAAMLATAGSAKKQCFLRLRRGISRVTSSRSGDVQLSTQLNRRRGGVDERFVRDFLAFLPEHCLGADFLLNSLTHDDFIPRGLSVLAPGGRFVELGKLRVWSAQSVQHFRRDVIHATMLLDARVAGAAPSLAKELRAIAAAVQAIHPSIFHEKTLAGVLCPAEAFQLLQSARQVGKARVQRMLRSHCARCLCLERWS
ncbi:ppsC [Symbiodinium natans]|uniref:PpsC protein n=1 Tax=Symbiodinium natans TaxID=878477 RepID=A0A812RRY2_9DINO|nr:ppsC [Symbiodinium natans]